MRSAGVRVENLVSAGGGGGVCTAVLKQGELQSGNNGSKVMADFCESYGELCSDMCAQASILYMYIISLYDNTCDVLFNYTDKALSVLPYLLPDACSQ